MGTSAHICGRTCTLEWSKSNLLFGNARYNQKYIIYVDVYCIEEFLCFMNNIFIRQSMVLWAMVGIQTELTCKSTLEWLGSVLNSMSQPKPSFLYFEAVQNLTSFINISIKYIKYKILTSPFLIFRLGRGT